MEFLQTRQMLVQLRNTRVKSHGEEGNLSCVPAKWAKIMSKYNCECSSSLPSNICHESTNDEPEIPVILWSISGCILVILIVNLFAIRFARKSCLENILGKLIYCMGIISSLVTQLCTIQYLEENSKDITIWYNIVLGFVTVFCIVFGYRFLFVKPNNDRNHDIGSHDKGMGLVVGAVSLLVAALEIILIIMVNKRQDLGIAFGIFLLVFAVEKIVQVVVYIHIRRLTFDDECRSGAVFYFSLLSFINFNLWINSIPFADIPIYDELAHDDIFQYVDETYKALIIDYRLLCALLFLEHAMEISEAEEQEHEIGQVDQEFPMPEKRHLYTAIGLGVGLVFLALEIISASQLWSMHFPIWVNIFPIVVDVGLVVLAVCLLLVGVQRPFFHTEKVSLVTLMVSFMGAASIIYLLIFGLLSFTSFKHDSPVSCVRWSAFVFLVRGSSLFVLLFVYTGIPVSEMKLKKHFKIKNYFLVSAVCSGMFARFVGNVLDEFNDTMHNVAHHHLASSKLRPLRDLFTIGPLFQLAATLHITLHFLLFIWRLHFKPMADNDAVVEHEENQNGEPNQGDGANGIAGAMAKPPEHSVKPSGQVIGEPSSGFVSSGVRSFEPFGGSEQMVVHNDNARLLQSC